MQQSWFGSWVRWNPQLKRELQGRLKGRNLIIAILLSLLLQGILVLGFASALPGDVLPYHLQARPYPNFIYNYDYSSSTTSPEPSAIVIQQVYQDPALTQLPGWDLSTLNHSLTTGDAIVAVNGVAVNGDYGVIDRLMNNSSSTERPLSDLWQESGTPVTLTLSRSGQTLDVMLPFVVQPMHSNTYCQSTVDLTGNTYNTDDYYRTPYCLVQPGTTHYLIHWSRWFRQLFMGMSWALISPLLVLGTFLLIADLDQENQRGTLNFLRLSPQSAGTIVGGKILGVPVLLYLALAMAVPLHLGVAIAGEISAGTVLGIYGIWAFSCALCLSAASLFGLMCHGLKGFQAWLGAGIVVVLYWVGFSVFWFGSPNLILSHGLMLFHPMWLVMAVTADAVPSVMQGTHTLVVLTLLSMLNASVWTFWIWKSIYRCFHRPGAIALSKRQSYGITLSAIGMMFGISPIFQALAFSDLDLAYWDDFDNAILITGLHLVLMGGLALTLLSSRQFLQDWARYRHIQRGENRRRSLLWDLVWGEQSPAMVALWVNMVLFDLAGFFWLLLFADTDNSRWFVQILSCSHWVLMYATLAQMILARRGNRQSLWAIGWISVIFVAQVAVLPLLKLYPNAHPSLWLLSFPWAFPGGSPIASVFVVFVAQWTAILGLNGILTVQLRRLGTSSTQNLLPKSVAALQPE